MAAWALLTHVGVLALSGALRALPGQGPSGGAGGCVAGVARARPDAFADRSPAEPGEGEAGPRDRSRSPAEPGEGEAGLRDRTRERERSPVASPRRSRSRSRIPRAKGKGKSKD